MRPRLTTSAVCDLAGGGRGTPMTSAPTRAPEGSDVAPRSKLTTGPPDQKQPRRSRQHPWTLAALSCCSRSHRTPGHSSVAPLANLPFRKWSQITARIVAAVIDRITFHAHIGERLRACQRLRTGGSPGRHHQRIDAVLCWFEASAVRHSGASFGAATDAALRRAEAVGCSGRRSRGLDVGPQQG